jgi:hypothetical protein
MGSYLVCNTADDCPWDYFMLVALKNDSLKLINENEANCAKDNVHIHNELFFFFQMLF